MERRELLKVIAATLVAGRRSEAHLHHADSFGALDVTSYQPRFFSQSQYRTIVCLCQIIVPSDDQSPGAREAGVPFFIDTKLLYGEPQEREAWLKGLAAVEQAATLQFHRSFLDCPPNEQDKIVEGMAGGEAHPASEAEKFFARLKRMTLEGYVLSEVGMRQYLGYKGNTAIGEFVGCTHPEHQH